MSISPSLEPRAGELYGHTAIRGLAALSVVAYHAMLGSAGKVHTNDPLQSYFLNSYIFVDFFFILSGYIIYENYAEKIFRSSLFSSTYIYLKKRALKILPNYYFWLTIAILVTFFRWAYFKEAATDAKCVQSSIIKHYLLIQNLEGSCLFFNTPLWSIAAEVIAYFIFPFIVIFKINKNIIVFNSIALYIVLFSYSPSIDIIDGSLSVCRCLAGFSCGVALAQISFKVLSSLIQFMMFIALMISISLNYQVLSLALMAAITVATSNNESALTKLCAAPLPYLIGRSSFSIYLAHIPVATVISTIAYKVEKETGIPFGTDWRLIVPIEVFCSAVIGYIAFQQIERRFERVINRRRFVAQSA